MKKRHYHPIKGWHLGLMIGSAIAVIFSWKWSLNILSGLFDLPTGIFLASIVTMVEIYFLMQFILTFNPVWLIGVVPGFILSVAGSYGNFQTNYEQNVAKSVEYQRKESEIKGYESEINTSIRSADEYSQNRQPWYAKRERARADQIRQQKAQAEEQLKGMTDKGYGSSNALFRSIARHTDMTSLDSAEYGHLGLGLFVEIFMLVATVLGTVAMKKGYTWVKGNDNEYDVSWDEDGNTIYTKRQPKKDIPRKELPSRPEPEPRPRPTPHPTPAESPIPVIASPDDNGVKHTPPSSRPRPERETNQFKIDAGFRSEKKKPTLNELNQLAKEERKELLKEYISNHPGATYKQKCEACGVTSVNTVKTYEEELGIRPSKS